MSPDRDAVLVVFVLVSAVMANAFALFYLYRPWRSTPQGRALMVKSWGNVIVLDMALAFALFGDYPGRMWIRLLGFGFFMVGISWLTLSLLFSPGAKKYPPWTWLRR